MISVLVFILASAALASPQTTSNFNCSIYERIGIPADFTPLVNFFYGNDSHAEYGNESNYDWTVACKSNITEIGYGCTETAVSVLQLYNYTDAHVSVDDYYNRNVCFNMTNDSVVWHYNISDTGMTPAGYECAFSIFQMEDAHVYDCDNINSSYNVNLRITEKPLGTMTIVGPNGTILTATQNVFLNLTQDAKYGLDKCRWANDDAADLVLAPWENCTNYKPWILSDGEGNKTVYYQIIDVLGVLSNPINASIDFSYTQDYTAPTSPIVYDGLEGDDIDWWNSNTTLHAHWFNATDDISVIYYRYRVLENGSCYGDCNWTEAGLNTSVTVTGLSLNESWWYSFEVQPSNAFGIDGAPSQSNGTMIDITAPAIPSVNSTSHPQENLSYPVRDAELNWTAEDIMMNGNMSGIAGYSFMLDTSPGTAPDDILDERYLETILSGSQGTSSQLLRADNETSSPHTYAVFKQIHTNLTENDSLTITAYLAELTSDYDDPMGVKVYLIKTAPGAGILTFSQEDKAISDISNTSQDIIYADTMDLARAYTFSVTVNETVDINSNDIYVVVSGDTSDDDNRNNLSIAGTAASAGATSVYLCDDTNSCSNVTSTADYTIKVERSDAGDGWSTMYKGLSDGVYYFHVKAKDIAGNWGEPTHYRIAVAAGGVSVSIVHPENGEHLKMGQGSLNTSVEVVVSGNATVRVTVIHPDNSVYTTDDQVFSTRYEFSDVLLELGRNEIYATANTSSGVVTVSSSVYVTVSRGIIPEKNATLMIAYGACAPSSNPYLCTAAEGDSLVGFAAEYPDDVGTGYLSANTSGRTIKIFMSKVFNVDAVADKFDDDEFLDEENPSFGYPEESTRFVMQNQLRYDDIFISGDKIFAPGKYELYIIHNGVTPDGRVNLSIEIR
ncbi:MAG: hypothetical protein ABIA62_03400 [Candidatus Woesearchaeota archaeon]